MNNTLDALLKLGAEKANNKEWFEAERLLREALKLDPNHPSVLTNLGGVLYFAGKIEEAESILKLAFRQSEIFSQSYYYWAKICVERKKYQEAQEAILACLQARPDYSEAYDILGEIYWEQNNWQLCSIAYCRCLQTRPSDMNIWRKLAGCWVRQGLMGPALEGYYAALKLHPNSAELSREIKEFLGNLEINAFKEKKNQLEKILENDQCCISEKKEFLEKLNQGRLREGFEKLAEFAREKCNANYKLDIPYWCGEYFSGKRLIIYDEHWFEDSPLFFRYLPLVKQRGGIVILAVREEWVEVCKNLVGIDYIICVDEILKTSGHLKISLLELPFLFGATAQSTLHFSADKCIKTNSESVANVVKKKEKRCIGVACSREVCYCLKKVMKSFELFKWSMLNSISDFTTVLEELRKVDVLISDNRQLCHLAGVFGISFVYLVTYEEDSTWWTNLPVWYLESSAIRQVVPGDWFLLDLELNDFFKSLSGGKYD